VADCSDQDTFFSKRSFERVDNSVIAYRCGPQGPQATKQWADHKTRLDAQSFDHVGWCLTD